MLFFNPRTEKRMIDNDDGTCLVYSTKDQRIEYFMSLAVGQYKFKFKKAWFSHTLKFKTEKEALAFADYFNSRERFKEEYHITLEVKNNLVSIITPDEDIATEYSSIERSPDYLKQYY